MKDYSKKLILLVRLPLIITTPLALVIIVVRIMFEDTISALLSRWGWNPDSFVSNVFGWIINHPIWVSIIAFLSMLLISLYIHFVAPYLDDKRNKATLTNSNEPIKVKLSYKRFITKNKIGLRIKNHHNKTIEDCSAQLHTIQQPNRQQPVEVDLTLIWAENSQYKIDLPFDKSVPLLIAKGEYGNNRFAYLITADGGERHIDIGESIIKLKFFGHIDSQNIIPIIQRFKLTFIGDGVFDIEEM